MKILNEYDVFIMKNITFNKIIKLCEKYIFSSSLDNLIFSYEIFKQETAKGMVFIIQQNEFNFSFSLNIEDREDKLTVISAHLIEDQRLKIQSLSLYDAAIIEIVIQSMDLIYNVFKKKDIVSIYFNLEKKQSDHFFPYKCFFNSFTQESFYSRCEMNISKSEYKNFFNKTRKIRNEVKKELWNRQKYDQVICRYLHQFTKGNLFPTKMIAQKRNEHSIIENIIQFPIPQEV